MSHCLYLHCCFNRESDSVTVGADEQTEIKPQVEAVSIAKAIPSLLERCRVPIPMFSDDVSIAKAIPSLLEPRHWPRVHLCIVQVSIAKAIPSLLELRCAGQTWRICLFQSRKRFRHCWSQVAQEEVFSINRFQSRKRFRHCWSSLKYHHESKHSQVSIAKAIPSLLEPGLVNRRCTDTCRVSIAKAIPSLLEPGPVA